MCRSTVAARGARHRAEETARAIRAASLTHVHAPRTTRQRARRLVLILTTPPVPPVSPVPPVCRAYGAVMHTAALVACSVLACLVAFQACLALGAPWGRLAWGGRHDGPLPRGLRVASGVSIALYAAMGALLLDRAGLVRPVAPEGVVRVLSWVLVGYLALGVVMNALSRSRAERAVMTPTALVLAACSAVVAAGPSA